MFGSATELPQGARYVRLEAPMIGELLFSPRNGWFSTHPIAYLGAIGLFMVPARARFAAAGLVAAKRGHPAKVEIGANPAYPDPDAEANANGVLLPGPGAILAGPTFESWLETADV